MNWGENNRVDHFAVCHPAGCCTHANPVNPVIVSSTSYVYDQYGRQIETIDALNQSTHTVYDLRGSVVKQYGATYPVWYEYDAEGRMVAMATTRDTALDPATVDSLDHPSLDVTRWDYDPATGLLVQKLYDDGKGPSYTYSPDGKLATRTWARGMVTEYGYDGAGELASVQYSDSTPDVAYTYDRIGRQLSAIAAGVSTNLYAYSTNTLELVSEIQNGVVIDRSRDAFGRESGIALESDYDVGYGYDTFGRFAQVSNFQFQVSYSYLSGSSLVSGMTASSGHAWTRSYEPQRNLITAVTNSFNGNLISAFDYANDAIGRRTARLDSQPAALAITNAFGYNIRSEVVAAEMGTNTYGYVFDLIGNRIAATNNADVTAYAANELNQYKAISNAVVALPTYDDDGNTTSTGDGWHYVWNGENRLILASNENVIVTHAYDHRGRMVWKAVAPVNAPPFKTITCLWDNFNIVAETVVQDASTNITYNVWGLDIDGTLQGAGGVGGLFAVIKDSAIYIPAWDANGNIMEYVAENGTAIAHREYDPFGRTVVATGEANAFTHWFSTKPLCDVTGLSEYLYRKYSLLLGQWLSRDPIGEMMQRNIYVFVDNQPGLYVDSFGMAPATVGGLIEDIVSNNEAAGCCYPSHIKEALRDDPVLRDALLNIQGKTQNGTGRSCLKQIKCTEHCPGTHNDCPSCKGTKAAYTLDRDEGVIHICSPTHADYGLDPPDDLKRVLKHEMQHAYQCGSRPMDCGKDIPPHVLKENCRNNVLSELQARICSDTSGYCELGELRRTRNMFSCVSLIWRGLTGDGGSSSDPEHVPCKACLTVPNNSDYVERIDEILENWRLPSVDVIGRSCFTKPK